MLMIQGVVEGVLILEFIDDVLLKSSTHALT